MTWIPKYTYNQALGLETDGTEPDTKEILDEARQLLAGVVGFDEWMKGPL